MIYKAFQNLQLPALGFGAMRLPIIGDDYTAIDEAATAEMVASSMEHGVNYFDTAWGYHEGNSERVMGKILKEYPRDSLYLATKFPGYDLSNMDKVEEIFEKQLEKCQVEHFDFYMLHNVCELNIDAYLDPKFGVFEYLKKQKDSGRIRHLGFSAHGSYDVMERFLQAYGEHMEFCQLQLNYLDWSFQNAKGKMDLLKQYQIPVWSMEPLRGGKLVLPDDPDSVRRAFRFLQSLPDVVVTLSGMSNMEQLKENIAIYAEEKPLNEQEMRELLDAAEEMVKKIALPCTNCRYCIDHCPQGLDIPGLLELYNEHCFTGGGFIAPMVIGTLPAEKQPSACTGCRSCEAVCPQQIKISEAMADFAAKLGA